ncbi:type II toxin-antitoxin system PemK/MazF family toxin [Thermococcus indicus]|uniref:Type II toxin-antitoxin system PemK/MazF family toxin n=2 Tax=Thermococcus indicus TaxID=2586643 RepID=A0A4Y5SMK8_9EURY|nr:type II toxin-antitoxin system PemK/MazF family toxin [Thermococcus indicus]
MTISLMNFLNRIPEIGGCPMEQGEIWTAPFPYFDEDGGLKYKHRPVLIISGDTMNNNGRDVVVCQISRFELKRVSALSPQLREMVRVIKNDDLDPNTSRGLRNVSMIKLFKLFTMPKTKLRNGRYIGKLKEGVITELAEKTRELF